MPEAVYHQSSFLGGEWSALAQGRSENPAYKTALNVCLNALPAEEGAWLRRSGTQYLGPTAGRTTAKLLPFASGAGDPYVMEFTNAVLRFWGHRGRVTTNDERTVTASTTTGGFTLTLDTTHGWVANEYVVLWSPTTLNTGTNADVGPFLNRVYKIYSAPTTSSITLLDDQGNAVGSAPANVFVNWKVYRIKQFTTSWTASLDSLRVVQAREQAVILHPDVAPTVLEITTEATGDDDPVFAALAAVSFIEGPFLDSQLNGTALETGTVSGYTGSITFTPAVTAFVAADVGRLIRLWQEPPAWNSGTTYSYGDAVTYEDKYWVSIAAGDYASNNVGVVPGTLATVGASSVTLWAPTTKEGGRWAWGTITAQAGTSCTVSLTTDLNSGNGTTISEFQLGVYFTGQYPTCGVYHDGRLWLAGAVANRIDISKANDPFNFAQTDEFGFVADDNAIAGDLNFDKIQVIRWLLPDQHGVIVGSAGGEVLITASELNDPITPDSRQANKVTNYQVADAEPVRAGNTIVFIQRYGRRLIEYMYDGYAGRFAGRHLNEFSKHLAINGVSEIVYQEETAPVIWCRDSAGKLTGHTYRRISRFVTDEPAINAAHRHQLADDNRRVASMCVIPGADGLADDLYLCTYDTAGSDDYAIEVLWAPLKEAE